MHTPRPASAPELRDTTPGRGGDSPSVASARGLGIQADGQYQLFTAIKERNVDRVKFELSRMESARDTQKATLLHASKRVEFRCQSPLMAAAASGEVEMFTVVLDAWRTVCRSADCSAQADLRFHTMQHQLGLEDMDKMTLLMHATRSGDMTIFQAVAEEIGKCPPRMIRRLLSKNDVRGMTFLMYATSAGGSTSALLPGTPAAHSGMPELDISPPSSHDSSGESEDGESCIERAGVCVDPWVPLVKKSFDLAKKCLCMPEYRLLLKHRDLWGRCILEHSVASKKEHVFEATYAAVREDVYDEEVAEMMETGEEFDGEKSKFSSTRNHPMGAALKTCGEDLTALVSEKDKSLKRDIALRSENSTVASRIQAFIPGNLIVIFQLLLPECAEDSNGPLILLVVLCAIAPFWAWGSSLMSTKDPERKNAAARHTAAAYVLSIPAMFFWGVGTSTIGSTSFRWGDTTSAAALAVASIVIPACDSFFSGIGARRVWGKVVILMLDISEFFGRGRGTGTGCKSRRSASAATSKPSGTSCLPESAA